MAPHQERLATVSLYRARFDRVRHLGGLAFPCLVRSRRRIARDRALAAMLCRHVSSGGLFIWGRVGVASRSRKSAACPVSHLDRAGIFRRAEIYGRLDPL